MSEPETLNSAEAPDDAPDMSAVVHDSAGQAAPSRWALRLPPSPRTVRLAATVGSVVVLLALLPAMLNASHNPAGAQRARPTATSSPTTASSPTAMPGYQPLVDREDGFIIQHPLDWSCSASNPGVDCIDSPDAQNYRLQVQLPGNWTGADTGPDPNDASVWVDYALGAFSDVPGRTYERVPSPSRPATFGGATWQSGVAIIGMEQDNPPTPTSGTVAASPVPQVRIRVQVYATVHDTKPYIIALYAADDHFSTGNSLYFQPMLKSFAFLPNNNQQ